MKPDLTKLDHRKKYMVIDGHLVTLSFTKEPNLELYDRLKSILLSSTIITLDHSRLEKKETVSKTRPGNHKCTE